MYPSTPTETELLNQLITEGKPKTTELLKELIESHNTSHMREGVNYYFNQSDILKRKQVYWKDGQQVIDTDKPNNKIPHGWHKLLVDQKTSYLVGQSITISSEDEKLAEKVNDILGDEFDDIMPELIKNASNKGREWLHPFIDEEGNFDYMLIPAEEVIPLYDLSKKKALQGAVRYYQIGDVTKIELWDKETVTYYEMINGEVYLDVTVEINPAPHFNYGEQGFGWGEVPFIEFKNNEEAVSDLTFYKQLIDAFDLVVSDVSNNLEEIQSLIYVLKGYEGQGLSEFMDNLKKYKAISVEAEQGSGVDTIQAEVPIDSVNSHLDRLESSIYTFGQGVDISTDKFATAPSGVSLKFLFSLLDMKANWVERKFTKGLYWLFWFVTEYLKMTKQVPDSADYKQLKATFNKSILVNELEQVQMAQQSLGIAPKRTILENHPWVENVDEALTELQKEQDEYTANLASLGGGTSGSEPTGQTS